MVILKTPSKKLLIQLNTHRQMQPTKPIWRAVAEMEQSFYTRDEIAETLREVADQITHSEP